MKHLIFLLLSGFLFAAHPLEKAAYDLDAGSFPMLGKAQARSIPARSFIQNQSLEASVVEGAFFTLGTNEGQSASALDDKCCLTFGHPYALTSYPILKIDGDWGRLADFTDISKAEVKRTSDTVTFVYQLRDSLEFTFSIFLAGASALIESRVKNIGHANRTIQAGLMYDPGMGWFNPDAAAWINGSTPVTNECCIQNLNGFKLTEKGAGQLGLSCSMNVEHNSLESFTAANWSALETGCFAPWPASNTDAFYDLTLRLLWQVSTLMPDSNFSGRLQVRLDAPNFGQNSFVRWDCPRFMSIENGALFPRTFESKAYICNQSATDASINLLTDFPYQAICSSEAFPLNVPGLSGAYKTISVKVRENYANDTIVPLILIAGNNVSEIDRVETNLFIPLSPYSDTGLTVEMDSFFTNAAGEKILTFNAKINNPEKRIFDLAEENISFHENNISVNDYFLGPDTNGGASNIDLVFVLDVTGSMGNEIEEVKNNINRFADTLSTRGVNYRLGMVTFLDDVENIYPLTDNLSVFNAEVNLQSAHGGGDAPENSLQALQTASRMSYRPDARRILIWITDAPYQQNNWATKLVVSDVVPELIANDICVYSVGPEEERSSSYFPIYNPTGGKWFNISGPFLDVLMDVAGLQYSKNMMILYKSGVAPASVENLKLAVHYSGLGGNVVMDLKPTQQASLGKAVQGRLVCSPNPCNPVSVISFNMKENTRAKLSVCDIRGREVFRQIFKDMPGDHSIKWAGRSTSDEQLGSGIYIVRLVVFSEGKNQPDILQQKLVLSR